MTETLTLKQIENYKDIANQLRIDVLESTFEAGSGHLTSCASMAEIMSVLFFGIMRFDIKNPQNPANDRFILSKGHAAPILYSVWAESGYFPREHLLSLRKFDSDLEGHPTPRADFIPVATGSLGNGIGVACGMAYVGKYFDQSDYLVYCLIGDGESSEGSVWEACNFASFYKLDNLVLVVDVNRLGQSGPAPLDRHVDQYCKRFESFGWECDIVDGHSIEELFRTFVIARDSQNQRKGRPYVILASTTKGKGIEYTEDKVGFHGKPCDLDHKEFVLNALLNNFHGKTISTVVQPPSFKLNQLPGIKEVPPKLSESLNYKIGQMVATREAYGKGLTSLGKDDPRIISLDCDVKNSTKSDLFQKKFPQRFIECFIAEQNMVNVAIGCSCYNRTIPFISTFSCFLTRAFDQLRMAAISKVNLKVCGSHCGISIGEDGPSQMGLEDIALFRTLPESTIFYPTDAVSCERAVELAAQVKGISYIRTTRPETPVIYSNDESFAIGSAKVLRKTELDIATIVTAGYTLYEALKALDILKNDYGLSVSVIDLFTVKPLDRNAIKNVAKDTGNNVITVEDHYEQGGIGEAVCSELALFEEKFKVVNLAVRSLPRSGKAEELVEAYGIGARAIVEQVLKIAGVQKKTGSS